MSWSPDWTSLNAVAAAFLQSTPLSTRIASVTPPGGYIATGLQMDLAAIVAAAATDGMLVITVDTLSVPAGTTALTASGLQIVARSVQVAGGGTATLAMAGAGSSLQITAAQIAGTLSVTRGGGDALALALSSRTGPQTLTLVAGAPAPVLASDAATLADVMHSPWSLLQLQLTGAVAGVVADQGHADARALAESMLRWVSVGGSALLANAASYPALDVADLSSLLAAATAQLSATQTAASGAIYVPVLSADLYQTQVNVILGLAQVYDQRIAALQNQQTVQQELAAFATTLGNVNQQAVGPLLATLKALANETAMLETQLGDAATQLNQILATLPDLQAALTKAINDQFQHELLESAIHTLFTLATLYVGAAAAVLGDPELLAGNAQAMLKAALEEAKTLLEAAQEPLTAAISGGLDAGGEEPSVANSGLALQGGQMLAASLASFGAAMQTLWTVVGTAVAGAPAQIVYTPDFLSKLEAAPDLGSFTTAGVDPVTYWNVVVTQTQATVQPHSSLPQAAAYLTAVQLAATYGSAIGDLQMKLLDLYTQGVTTFARLQAVYQAQAQWTQLQGSLSQEQQQAQAAVGLLQRGYLNIKRALVGAVNNYRAAFRYQWLQDSSIAVDVSMNYTQLAQQAEQSIESLVKVLSGTPSGPLQPRQSFSGVSYTVKRTGGPLFERVDGVGQAQWSIDTSDPALASQLGGNTAIYLEGVSFELQGGAQPAEVQLRVATSGRYQSLLGRAAQRFVSQAVSMNNLYKPGNPPTFITRWQFSDPAAYMMPTPYTNWTLQVLEGNWQDATAITMVLSGKFLQNPTR